MTQGWQKINVDCLFCHWWRDHGRRSITAMTYLMILLAIVVVMSIETVRLAIRDGRGPQRPPASHVEDPRFRSPAIPR
jgi:hypothetical protein